MKTKNIFFILIFIFISELVQAQLSYQESINAQRKYWYYRYRLLNDFMLEGGCQGCSLPAMERYSTNWPHYHIPYLEWGDTRKELGMYIGVLATEYKMLSDNNESTDSTQRELYFAMQAILRLDNEAEPYLNSSLSGNINGLYLRDDVHSDFITNHDAHFNSGKTSQLPVNMVKSDYESNYNSRHDRNSGHHSTNHDVPGQDGYVYTTMGLALVIRLVPNTINYNGFNFSQEARDIINRTLLYAANDFNSNNTSYHWKIELPLNPIFLPYFLKEKYGGTILFAPGFAEAGCRFSSNCALYQLNVPLLLRLGWYGYSLTIGWNYCQSNNQCKNSYMLYPLAAVANMGGSVSGGMRNWMGKAIIQKQTYAPLLWAVLWNKDISKLPYAHRALFGTKKRDPVDSFDVLINTAPCVGPYWFPSNSIPAPYTSTYASWRWSTPALFRQSLYLGNNSSKADGEYNGLDYMLFHNLYY